MANYPIPPVWILAGPEVGLKGAFIADLIDKARRLGEGEPEVHRMYAGDSSPSEAIEIAAVRRSKRCCCSKQKTIRSQKP